MCVCWALLSLLRLPPLGRYELEITHKGTRVFFRELRTELEQMKFRLRVVLNTQ